MICYTPDDCKYGKDDDDTRSPPTPPPPPPPSKTNIFKFQIGLDYFQALYREPLAWEIGKALPVLLLIFDIK